MISTCKLRGKIEGVQQQKESKAQQERERKKKGGGAKREQRKIKLGKMEREGQLGEDRKGAGGGERLCGWCNLSVSEG